MVTIFTFPMEKSKVWVIKNDRRFISALWINYGCSSADPVKGVTMNTKDIEKTHHYWHPILNMNVQSKSETEITFSYGESQAFLRFKKTGTYLEYSISRTRN